MIMSQRKPWNAWGALVCLCGMPSCVHAQTKNIAVWIDIEDPVLSPGESTLVTVWAKLDPAPGTQVQFGIPGAGVYPGTVLGFGHIAVWNIINDLGTAAGNFGLPAEHNPAFIIDQGKYGYFKYGCVLTLSSYNYSPGDIFFNPNATPDNPVWLYRATFTPTDYLSKTITIEVQANPTITAGIYVPDWPPIPPNPSKIGWQNWKATYTPGYISVVPVACDADCDGDNTLNIDDFICFQTLYAIGDPKADCDADGQLLIDDFICFQTLFAIGC